MIHREPWYREAVRPIRIDPDVVEQATNVMLRDLRNRSREVQFWSPDQAFGYSQVSMEDVMGETRWIQPIWAPVEGGYPWGFTRGAFFGYGSEGQIIVAIKFNARVSPEDVLEMLSDKRKLGTLRDQVRDYLYHELTHAVDKKKPSGSYIDPNVDPERYFQDPREVRAFMQQVAQDAYRAAQAMGEDLLWWYSSKQELIQALLSHSKSWREVFGRWTLENRKLVLRGVWNFLEDRGILDVWEKSRRDALQQQDALQQVGG